MPTSRLQSVFKLHAAENNEYMSCRAKNNNKKREEKKIKRTGRKRNNSDAEESKNNEEREQPSSDSEPTCPECVSGDGASCLEPPGSVLRDATGTGVLHPSPLKGPQKTWKVSRPF